MILPVVVGKWSFTIGRIDGGVGGKTTFVSILILKQKPLSGSSNCLCHLVTEMKYF